MKNLPIYRVATVEPSIDRMNDLAAQMFDLDDFSLQETDDGRVLQSANKVIEIGRETGTMWAVDYDRFLQPDAEVELPDRNEAPIIAQKFVSRHELLPRTERDDRITVQPLGAASSFVATYDQETGKRTDRNLDYNVAYSVRMMVKDPEADAIRPVPVVDGSGKINVVVGHRGQVIAYNGGWRPIETADIEAPYMPREVVDDSFKQMTSWLDVQSFDADLAYAVGQDWTGQRYLYPVWAYRATANVRGRAMPLRIITLPATEFGPQPQPMEYHLPRVKHVKPEGSKIPMLGRGPRASSGYEAGTHWIGTSGGLSGSKKNAQGFVDGLKNAGWNIRFNWGDYNAWEDDWHENDDQYVDDADFVFYTGHADGNGWMLYDPGTTNADSLHWTEVNEPNDRWGRQDLEWVVVAACGPLQDDILSPGGGNVLNRWGGAFDGLHLLMGYGAVTFDNQSEGKTLIKYARQGKTLAEAWRRTAQEIQPAENGYGAPNGPRIYVGVMWASKSGQTSPFNDHLWGYGSVAPDPTRPHNLSCMWWPT
jgi:hypothetical protein